MKTAKLGKDRMLSKQNIQYSLFLLPALIGFAIFFLVPLAQNLYYSFTNWNILYKDMDFIGFLNYINIFNDRELMGAIGNTLFYAILLTILQNAIAIPLAMALNRKSKFSGFYRLAFFIPAVISPLVVGFLWSYIMAPETGLLHGLFTSVGLEPVNWLGDRDIVMYSLVFVSLWQWTGWAAVVYMARLKDISKDYYDACRVDGATRWQVFRKITLPMLAPAMTINIVNSLIGSLKVYDIILSLTGGGPGSSSESITTVLIKRGFAENMVGYASAIAIVFIIMVVIISTVTRGILTKREDKLV